MEHPFKSTREEISKLREGIKIMEDIMSILAMGEENRRLISRRMDAKIENPCVRSAVMRRSCRLGILLEDLDGLVRCNASEKYGGEWEDFLVGGKEVSSSFRESLSKLYASVREKSSALNEAERESEPSSPSDYSASSTESESEES